MNEATSVADLPPYGAAAQPISLNDIPSLGILPPGHEFIVPDLARGKPAPPNVGLSERIWQEFEPGYRGHAVDVGASDGISVNTTWHLELARRWTVLCVEPNPAFASILKRERTWVELVACGAEPKDQAEFQVNVSTNPEEGSALTPKLRRSALTGEALRYQPIQVRVETLDRLLAKWEFPKLDLLAIDTEGGEMEVLQGIDLAKWRPRVIVSECWEKSSPLDQYLANLGYEKRDHQVDNDIFIRT